METNSNRTTHNHHKLYSEMVKATVEGFNTFFKEQQFKAEANVATRTPQSDPQLLRDAMRHFMIEQG